MPLSNQSLVIAGRTFRSRLILGTGKFSAPEVLREALGLKRSQVELLSGQTSRDKRFLVRGMTRKELESRLTDVLALG